MSIYLAKKELADLLEGSHLKFDIKLDFSKKIVAENKNGKELKFQDYTEENLKKMVAGKKNVYVNLDFWNYNYCTDLNIDPEVSGNFINNLSVVVKSLNDFSVGTLVILIFLHELLLNTFKIKSREVYLEYLEGIKISRKIIRNFMVGMQYHLPLTENYLILILEVFDKETIFDFLFKKCCQFTIEEFSKIMEYFELDNIHEMSYYIFERFKSKKLQLEYCKLCLILFEDKIDFYDEALYSKKNKSPHIGYYLLTLKLNPELENLYYSVIKIYMDKFGTLNLILTDDEDKNKFIKTRKKEILEYFDKY